MSAEGDSGDHLAVLVHGLWGNPTHLATMGKSLKERYPNINVLICQNNSNYLTYDGIETGGERVAGEVEDALAKYESEKKTIKRISVVGYSLGGLIARYAVGLLYARGWFDKLEAMNFTTFATPHLGTRSPHRGFISQAVWNFLGARTVSESGQQMFLADKFRDTGRPLVAVMADKDSIFMKGLAAFKSRTLYANAVNDRTVAFYTSSISEVDPFQDTKNMEKVYLPGYEPNVLDINSPLRMSTKKTKKPFKERVKRQMRRLGKFVPLFVVAACLLPIMVVVFLGNSVVQTFNSRKRIKEHYTGEKKSKYSIFRAHPVLLAGEMQDIVEGAMNLQNAASESTDSSGTVTPAPNLSPSSSTPSLVKPAPTAPAGDIPVQSKPLALLPCQFEMISNLNSLEWNKFPVWIHGVNHSHAAIVVRNGGQWGQDEGFTVLKHWAEGFIN